MKKITFLLTVLLAVTFCWQTNAQLSEGFESGLVSLTNEPGNGVDWAISTSYFSEGAQSAHNAYASSNTNILTSGSLDISGLTTPRLTFDHIAKTEGGYDFCYVEVSTDGTNWTIIGTYDEDSYAEWGTTSTTPANDWWKSEIIDLSSYISATTYIRFRVTSDSSVTRFGWILDNVEIEETPTDELDYYNLQWPGSGTIVNGDGYNVYAQAYEAGLTDANSTPAAGIEAWIGYSTSDTDPSGAGWTWITAPTNPGYDFSANNDEFELDLDATLGSGVYYYASRFRLNGGPYTYGGFDAGLGGADGAWDGTEDISGVLTINPGLGEACSNPINLVVESDCSIATPYTLDYSTALDLGTTELSCDTAGVNTGSWFEFTAPASGSVTVFTSDSNEIAVFDLCGGTEIVCNSTAATSHIITGLTGSTVYKLAVWKDSASSGTSDICIEDLTCPDPSGMNATNVTDTTADLVWTAGGSESAWNLEWKAGADFTPGMGEEDASDTASVTPAYNATGLMSNTTYYIYYQADCGAGDTSNWIGPFVGTTLCALFTPDYTADMSNNPPDNCWLEADSGDGTSGPGDFGSGLWYSSNHNGTPSNAINLWQSIRSDWIISPEFDLSTSAPSELKVYVALTNSGTSGTGESMGSDDQVVLYMTTDSGANWTALQTWAQGTEPTEVGEEITYDLTAQTGTVQFAFWGSDGAVDDTNDVYFHVSGFTVREIPTCDVPTNLVSSNITETTADFTWSAGVSGETAWEYALVAGGSGEPASGTSTSTANYSASSLTANSNYDFYVRADCGGGELSSWIMTSIYTGHCIPAAGTSSSTYVDNFSTTNGGINISNLASGYATDSYGDYTTQKVSQAPNLGFDFNIEIVGGTLGVAIWVDWNQDLTFDPGTETVFNTTSYGSGPYSGTITVPDATPNGDYKMRVMVDWYDSNPSDDPCQVSGTTTRFEVEDYTITVDSSLSVDETSFNGFKYFPNPVEGTLSLRAQQNMQNIAVFNMLGQEVISIASNSMSKDLDTSSLSVGTYFVRVSINGAVENFKIIKE